MKSNIAILILLAFCGLVASPFAQGAPSPTSRSIRTITLPDIRDLPQTTSDFYPLSIAISSGVKDDDLIQWLSHWAAIRAQSDSKIALEEASEKLGSLLSLTTCDPVLLADIGHAMCADSDPTTRLFGAKIIAQAVASLGQSISASTRPAAAQASFSPEVKAHLWMAASDLGKNFFWEEMANAYHLLTYIEPEGSSERYRAILKYADITFIARHRDEALTALDALIRDVDQGKYPDPSYIELSKMRLAICEDKGIIGEGLKDLRTRITSREGKPDHERLLLIYIRTAAQVGNVDVAKTAYGEWATKYLDKSREAIRQGLANDIATAESAKRPSSTQP